MQKHQRQLTHSQDWSWPFWPTVPLYPYGQRRTLRQEVVPDTIWTFDQLQGILYVVVPIRMTVVRLETGGLLVYAPIAPTPECIRLINELVAQYGDVLYIILPTVSGLEHKVFVGPFARYFSKAQVFVAPHQWSFPVNLPLSWLGFPPKRTHILPANSAEAPFFDEFDYALLGPIGLGLGPFAEVAFFHRRSQTLLVTDSVLSIPLDPPAIVQLDPFPLLFHAKDNGTDVVADNEQNRRKGWQRIVLFTFYFRPSALEVVELGRSLREATQAPDRSKKALWGWFPFKWKETWPQSFVALWRGGRLLVAPILQTLILNRAPQETIAWAKRVARWHFHRIIPCHFSAPITATPDEFRQAFAFLEQPSAQKNTASCEPNLLPEEDLLLLKQIEQGLNKQGILPPAKGKI